MEEKGEEESIKQDPQTQPVTSDSSEQPIPNVNIYAAIRNCVINGGSSSYFMNAILDLNSDLPVTKSLISVQKIRSNSMK